MEENILISTSPNDPKIHLQVIFIIYKIISYIRCVEIL